MNLEQSSALQNSAVAEALRAGFLRCPDCSSLITHIESEIVCSQCGSTFPSRSGILDLRPRRVRTDVPANVTATNAHGGLVERFIAVVYARHNKSRHVKRALERFWKLVPGEALGLNVGSGTSAMHQWSLNLDAAPGPNVAVLGDANTLPFADCSMKWVVCQEVFEHLPDPFHAAREAARVLTPGGCLYLQVPFIIGAHSLPHDYYRFTAAGVRELIAGAALDIVEIGPSVGSGTASYRVLTELLPAFVNALGLKPLYKPVKAISAILFSPLRLFDYFSPEAEESNRIHGGYYVIAVRPK